MKRIINTLLLIFTLAGVSIGQAQKTNYTVKGLINGPKLKKFYDDLKKLVDLKQLVLSEPLSRDFKLKYKRNHKKEKD
jgi:hypothetical protein